MKLKTVLALFTTLMFIGEVSAQIRVECPEDSGVFCDEGYGCRDGGPLIGYFCCLDVDCYDDCRAEGGNVRDCRRDCCSPPPSPLAEAMPQGAQERAMSGVPGMIAPLGACNCGPQVISGPSPVMVPMNNRGCCPNVCAPPPTPCCQPAPACCGPRNCQPRPRRRGWCRRRCCR